MVATTSSAKNTMLYVNGWFQVWHVYFTDLFLVVLFSYHFWLIVVLCNWISSTLTLGTIFKKCVYIICVVLWLGWLMVVQAFVTLALLFSFTAQVLAALTLVRWPLKFVLRNEWLLTGLCFIFNASASKFNTIFHHALFFTLVFQKLIILQPSLCSQVFFSFWLWASLEDNVGVEIGSSIQITITCHGHMDLVSFHFSSMVSLHLLSSL